MAKRNEFVVFEYGCKITVDWGRHSQFLSDRLSREIGKLVAQLLATRQIVGHFTVQVWGAFKARSHTARIRATGVAPSAVSLKVKPGANDSGRLLWLQCEGFEPNWLLEKLQGPYREITWNGEVVPPIEGDNLEQLETVEEDSVEEAELPTPLFPATWGGEEGMLPETKARVDHHVNNLADVVARIHEIRQELASSSDYAEILSERMGIEAMRSELAERDRKCREREEVFAEKRAELEELIQQIKLLHESVFSEAA